MQQLSTKLRPGERFPDVTLSTIDDTPISIDSLLDDKPLLVVILSVGCDPCSDLLQAWEPDLDAMSDRVEIVGICAKNCDDVSRYEAAFNISLFKDNEHSFLSEFGVFTYPTIIGIDEGGSISFIWEGYRPGSTLSDAYDALAASM